MTVFLGLAISALPIVPALGAAATESRTRAIELAQMSDKEFSSAFYRILTDAARAQASPRELWRVLHRLDMARTNAADPVSHSLQMGHVVRLMARHGSRADCEQLLDFADKLPAEGWHRRYFMNALLDFAAQLEVEALAARGDITIRLPATNAPLVLPDGLSPALLEAARMSARARSLHPPEPTNTWSAEANWGFFYDTLSALLRGRLTNASHQIQQFKWGGWCGTGRELLVGPQSRALFLALLQEGNHAAALGAVLRVGGSSLMSLSMLEDDLPWKRRYIATCGLDWEKLYAGELIAGPWSFDDGLARALARFASEKGARLLVDMAHVPTLADNPGFLLALGTLAGPTERVSSTNQTGIITFNTHWSHFNYVRPLSNAVSMALQLDVLKILGDKLRQPSPSSEVSENVVHILTELRRREAIPSLRHALQSPYERVRQKAATALRDFGEVVPKLESLPPVTFLFQANGKPLAEVPVEFNLQMTGGRGISSTPPTDREGAIRIERDYFVEARHVVSNVVFKTPKLKSLTDPWLEVQSHAPADLSRTTTVDVPLRPLSVAVSATFPMTRIHGQTARLRLKREKQASYGAIMEPISDDIGALVAKEIVFPSLQPGVYQVELRVPGASLWQSERIRVSDQGARVAAKLEPGADVAFQVVTPGGRSPSPAPGMELLRDGKPVELYNYADGLTSAFHSLPPGRYTLRVLSRAEQTRRTYGTQETVPSQHGYQGRDVPFTIEDNSPGRIDLGTIELLPAN